MKFLLSQALLCGTAFSLPHIKSRRESTKFTRLITFGDSFTDDGNGSWIISNQTWPSNPAYFGHHFSNGPVWAQDLAVTLNLTLLDYAVGGATADNNIVQGYTGYNSTIPVPSTSLQISSFLASSQTPITPTDILTLYIGLNDIFFLPALNPNTTTAIIESQVHTLYTAGARTVILATYPNPATMPFAANTTAYNDSDRVALTEYNDGLSAGLDRIATGWSPYMSIAVADVGGLFGEIQRDPEKYGVDERYVEVATACLTGTYPDSGPLELCTDPERHIFFDEYHPTGRIHGLMAGVFEEVVRSFLET